MCLKYALLIMLGRLLSGKLKWPMVEVSAHLLTLYDYTAPHIHTSKHINTWPPEAYSTSYMDGDSGYAGNSEAISRLSINTPQRDQLTNNKFCIIMSPSLLLLPEYICMHGDREIWVLVHGGDVVGVVGWGL